MGGGRFNMNAYKQQASAAAERPYDGGFKATSMCDEFDPKKVTTRYSKTGPFNRFRNVISVLIGLDVTGSMGDIPKDLLQGSLGNLITDLEKTFLRPNENLQICFTGVGDALNDVAPLQVAHFESDNRTAQQLQKLWLEGQGGGNGAESYHLVWWYGANKTQLNYVLQENRKGILITVGDDNVHPKLTATEIRKHLDPTYEGADISNAKLLEAAREQYEVYHIIVTDGAAYCNDTMTQDKQNAQVAQWKSLLGDNKVVLAESLHVAKSISEIIKRHRPPVKPGIANLTTETWEKMTLANLNDTQWLEVLSYTICSLSGKFMKQPGDWNGSKRCYEKEDVISYVRKNGKDPITNKSLSLNNFNFKINSNISQLCDDYRPYFDALPEARKTRLVQLALEQMKPAEKFVSSDPTIAVPDSNVSSNKPANVPAAALPPASNLPFFDRNPAAAVLNKDSDGAPHLFLCALTLELMDDPVLAKDGIIYERKEIQKYIDVTKSTFMSPKTGVLIGIELTPVHELRGEILSWKEEKAKKVVKP